MRGCGHEPGSDWPCGGSHGVHFRAGARHGATAGGGWGQSGIVNSHEPGQGAETVAEIEAQGGEALFVQGDVSSMSDCENLARKTLQAFGTISVLVNNAGIERRGGVVNTVEQDWDDIDHVIPIRRPGTW